MLQWEQSPIAKVDLVYQALKFTLASEVDNFWEDTDRFLNKAERNIDIDNLQGITIYIVWALKHPAILIDCLLTTEFLSKATKMSTRTLFLQVLRSSIDYLLDIAVDENPQETPDESSLKQKRDDSNSVLINTVTDEQANAPE